MEVPFSAQILAVVIMFCANLINVNDAKSPGCAAPLLLPSRPFFVVWNHPSSKCETHHIHLNFEKWGIIDNAKDKFQGEKMTLFGNLGHWPQYRGNHTYNGGIPQAGNLSYHLDKVQSDIKTLIPNASFSGLGVIDFEAWRPIYGLNFDSLHIYQQKSNEWAQNHFPGLNSTELSRVAHRNFDLAARSYMWKSLQEAVYLRPGGRWGYYGYPRCWDKYCNASTIRQNDKMNWIFNTSNSLYPSLYFNLKVPPTTRATIIDKKIHETLRVKAKWGPLNADIFPYASNQNGPYNLFTPLDLSYSIRQPADMGSSGVVLWGSWSTMQAKNECLILQDYINSTLGPFSLAVTNFFGNCTEQLCLGHGRCVRKDYEAFYQYHLRESGRTDCLIPEEKLKTKKTYKKLWSENFEPAEKAAVKQKSLFFRSEKNKGNLKNIHSPLAKLFDKLKLKQREEENLENGSKSAWKETEQGLSWENRLEHEDESSEAEYVSYYDKEQEFRDDTMREYDVSWGMAYDPQEFDFAPVDLGDNSDELPRYDFDDYVCKCFAGWSGPHCEHQDEE